MFVQFQKQQAQDLFADELLELEYEETGDARRREAEQAAEEKGRLLTVSLWVYREHGPSVISLCAVCLCEWPTGFHSLPFHVRGGCGRAQDSGSARNFSETETVSAGPGGGSLH